MKKKLIRVSTVPLSLYLLLEGQLKFLNQDFDVLGVSSPGKYLEMVKEREGIRVYPIEIKRHISLINDFVSLYKLYRLFKNEKPDIVHSITPKAGLLSMIAALLAGTPHRLHTFTGLVFPSKTGLIKKILILMDKLLCKCATNIYPEGGGVKSDLIKYKITNKPLKIIANGNINGIDTDFFSNQPLKQQDFLDFREKYSIKQNDFVFVFIGRLVKDKGINELIKSFYNLNKKGLKIKLILVGDFEPELDPLEDATLAEIEKNKNIIYVGFQTDIRPFLQISNVFVFPSYREGFPNVVLQACSMGVPCIVTDVSGSNEIIENEINGLIIKPKSIYELEESMINMINFKYDLKLMGIKSRQKMIDSFTTKLVWSCLLEEYKNLL
jgi:glycosyltransferase involved in cell wall biosynthesis